MSVALALALAAAAPVSGGVRMWTEAPPAAAHARATADVPALVRGAMPAVVGIVATTAHPLGGDPFRDFQRRIWGASDAPDPGPTRGIGTGFFLRPDGLIATNAHVIEGATDVAVHVGADAVSERVYRGIVVGSDEATDLALVRIDGEAPFPVLPLGDSDAAEVGEPVVAIGNPFGLSRSVTTGIVSYKGRRDVNPSGRPGYYDFIQTDAAINPGNSGGPLLDGRGAVIAIDAAVSPSGQGIGFAVPINMLKELLPQLVASGSVQRGWIGLSIQEQLTPELAQSFAVPGGRGVLVTEVAAGGPAQEAGLRPGDVILAFERQPIGESWRLRWLTSLAPPGRAVKLTVWRGGKQETASLTPRPKAAEPQAVPEVDVSRGADGPFGMALIERHGEETHGLRISALDLRGSAYRAGLREGDLLLEVEGAPVDDAAAFAKASAAAPQVARFFVRRGTRALFFGVRRDTAPQARSGAPAR